MAFYQGNGGGRAPRNPGRGGYLSRSYSQVPDIRNPGRGGYLGQLQYGPGPSGRDVETQAAVADQQRREAALGLTGRHNPPNFAGPYGISPWEFNQYNKGVFDQEFEGREYLGSFPDDTVFVRGAEIPYSGDNLSLRYFDAQKRKRPVYSKPKYRKGMEVTYGVKLGAKAIGEWQDFFTMNGFRTGPRGLWTKYEIDAMAAFMGMANASYGSSVEDLRTVVANSPDLFPPPGSGQPTLADQLGENGDGGGSGLPTPTEPYTETTTETRITEYDAGDALMLVRNYVREQIGRDPTDREVQRFLKNLNAAARADPTVITTVTTTDPMSGESTTDVTTDETAVNPEAMGLQFGEEVAPGEEMEYQAGRYMDAIRGLLGF